MPLLILDLQELAEDFNMCCRMPRQWQRSIRAAAPSASAARLPGTNTQGQDELVGEVGTLTAARLARYARGCSTASNATGSALTPIRNRPVNCTQGGGWLGGAVGSEAGSHPKACLSAYNEVDEKSRAN